MIAAHCSTPGTTWRLSHAGRAGDVLFAANEDVPGVERKVIRSSGLLLSYLVL